MVNLERELKYSLEENEYYQFLKYLKDYKVKCNQSINQINYYIDTKGFEFYKSGITARIRKYIDINENYELTFKIPVHKEEKNNIKIKNEYNFHLEDRAAKNILNNNSFIEYEEKIINIFNEINIKAKVQDLFITGYLITERSFYTIDSRLKPINVDINNYFGKKDYEIEWELDEIDEARSIIETILKFQQIFSEKKILSKNKRFYNEYFNRHLKRGKLQNFSF